MTKLNFKQRKFVVVNRDRTEIVKEREPVPLESFPNKQVRLYNTKAIAESYWKNHWYYRRTWEEDGLEAIEVEVTICEV